MMFGDSRLPNRFWKRIEIDDSGCWLWKGAKTPAGYGQTWWVNKVVYTHRLVFELFVGHIGSGFEIDHLCRARGCCNPTHLDSVSHKTNVIRGDAPSAKHALKTHCPYGHEYSEENTRIDNGSRKCKACKRAYDWSRRNGY